MIHRSALLGAALIATMSMLARAQDNTPHESDSAESLYSEAYATCMEISGGVTSAMLECSETELRSQDVRLNEAYQAMIATLDPRQVALLKEA